MKLIQWLKDFIGGSTQSTVQEIPEEPLKQSHLKDKADFDYSTAKYSPNGIFSIHSDEMIFYSVGKQDYFPLIFLIMYIDHQYERMMMYKESLRSTMGLFDSQIFDDWYEKNKSVFEEFMKHIMEKDDNRILFPFSDFAANAWQRANPKEFYGYLLVSEETAKMLDQFGWNEMVEFNQKFLNKFLDYGVGYFNGLGFDVDVKHHLVRISGYEPLYFVDRDPYNF